MGLSVTPEPWTVVVPWAQPWHRPPASRPTPHPGVPDPPVSAGPGAAAEAAADAEWRDALAALAAARDWLATLGPEDAEGWPGVMAAHAVRLAAARARAAEVRLGGPDSCWCA